MSTHYDLELIFLIVEFQIPEEEKDLGPHDRLIHVYHFTKETAQNQMVLHIYIFLDCFNSSIICFN